MFWSHSYKFEPTLVWVPVSNVKSSSSLVESAKVKNPLLKVSWSQNTRKVNIVFMSESTNPSKVRSIIIISPTPTIKSTVRIQVSLNLYGTCGKTLSIFSGFAKLPKLTIHSENKGDLTKFLERLFFTLERVCVCVCVYSLFRSSSFDRSSSFFRLSSFLRSSSF